MKLIDILARELKVWPEGALRLEQSFAGMIFYVDKDAQVVPLIRLDRSDDWRKSEVTRDQWQAAVDALKGERDKSELHKEVLRLFDYDPITGSLKWKDNQQARFIGREAGSINHHGYRRVNLGKTKLHAHQIIWLMTYGALPPCEIDHINGKRDDNRLDNLRLASQQQNQQNADVRIDNLLGVKGVRLRPSGRYQARVKLTDGSRAIKTFSCLVDAVSWLAVQRQQSHGEYARTPEQIAADRRLHEIRNALSAIHAGQNLPNDLVRGNIVAATVEAMIDAGYRKFEIVEGE